MTMAGAADGMDPRLTEDERRAVREFWEAYEGHRDEIAAGLRQEIGGHPEFRAVLDAVPPEEQRRRELASFELQRQAAVDGRWAAYLADLRAQGAGYAKAGISFPLWFDIVAAFRRHARPYLLTAYEHDRPRLLRALDGMNRFLDIAMAEIGQAYLLTKEQLIGQQQEAIRELSTPVLQLRDGLLMLPVVGVVDTYRARQLTESLLRSIRDNRARLVVLDITGVPAVDSKVANHLLQTADAARLMGATVILTGLSPEIAQTLVAIGVDLSRLKTVGYLQGGLETAERMLGYQVARTAPAGA